MKEKIKNIVIGVEGGSLDAEEAVNQLFDLLQSSLLLNNSLKIDEPVIYKREIYIVKFVDLKSELIDIESIDGLIYKGFIPLKQLTKIVL